MAVESGLYLPLKDSQVAEWGLVTGSLTLLVGSWNGTNSHFRGKAQQSKTTRTQNITRLYGKDCQESRQAREGGGLICDAVKSFGLQHSAGLDSHF